MEALL
ncbi:hypothetical protein S40285_10911 [Stachybotrys chlorohalonatus IBT 40285]|jgi:hypothetical protein